jgi:hypothetical protein
MWIVAISLFLLPTIASAQEADADQAKTINEEAIKAAVGFLNEEIQAGKLTKAQAISYVRCSQQDYHAAFVKSPYGISLNNMLKSAANADGETVVDAEMLKKMKTLDKERQAAEQLKDQAEERCMKKLGVKVPVGKIWGRR